MNDVFEVAGRLALLMPLVDGPDLADVLKRQRPTTGTNEQLFRGILAGVGHAHAHGIVHRDLKPANVLLESGPEGVVPRVTDFGIARVAEGELYERVGETLTRTRQFLGTPAYAAPEQARDARGVDHRADIFSLGVILNELYCGQRPFHGSDSLAVLHGAATEQYLDPSDLVPDLDPVVRDVIRACLKTDPDERPQGCAALRELLFPGEAPPVGTFNLDFNLDLTWDELVGRTDPGPPSGTSTPQLSVGDSLASGRYALQKVLAEGIFSTVWQAHDAPTELTIALKVLHPKWAQDPKKVQAFFHGASAMASLDHPAVARVLLPQGVDGLHRFYVMEYLAGGSLFAARLEGRLDAEGAAAAVIEAGSGLAAAHEQGLVRRDVEPRNIVLGKGSRAYLVDFDRVSGDLPADPGLTNPRGSGIYLAPEVHADIDAATPRSDLYSEQAIRLGKAGGRQQVVPMADNVLDLVTSPDESTVAAGLENGSVVLMDAITGEERATIEHVADRIYRLVWSPDSSLLAARDPRNHAQGETRSPAAVIDAAEGRVRYTLNHTGHVSQVAFSPDGRLVASASEDPVTLWDAQTGVFVARLEGTQGAGGLAWLSADRLVTGDPAAVWSVSQRVQVASLPYDNSGRGLDQPHVTPDGETLIYVDRGGVRAWDRATGEVIGHAAMKDARWVAMSPSGQRVATFFGSPEVGLWTLPGLLPAGTLVGHQTKPMRVALGGQGQVLTVSLDRTARLWSSLAGSPRAVLRGHSAGVHGATWAGGVPVTGRFVALGAATGELWAYDIQNQVALPLAEAGGDRVDALAFTPVRGELAASLAGIPTIYDLSGDRAPQKVTEQLQLSPNGRPHQSQALDFLADGDLVSWNKGTFQLFPGPPRSLSQIPTLWGVAVADDLLVEVSHSNPHVAGTDPYTGQIRWELDLPFQDTPAQPVPTADGSTVALPSYDGGLVIVDTATGTLKVAGTPHRDAITSVAWTDGDRALVTAGADGRALLLGADDLSAIEVLQDQGDALVGADPSPDGRCVALVGSDGFLRLHSREQRVVTAVYDLGEAALKAMRWTADSSALVAVTSDAEVIVWDGDCSTRPPDLLTETGGWTNLRLCPDDQTVVPVVPFPAPETVFAPEELCPGDAGQSPG